MSHEIIYSRKFIKVEKNGENHYIPLVLFGSNNCYDFYYDGLGRGREKRERRWFPFFSKEKKDGFLFSEEEIKEKIQNTPEDYPTSIKYNGKFIGSKEYKNFLKRGMKDSMTIEELKDNYIHSLGIYMQLGHYKERDFVEIIKIKAENSKDILYFNEKIKEEYENLLKKGIEKKNISINVYFNFEDFYKHPKEKKTRERKIINAPCYILYDDIKKVYPKKITKAGLYYSKYDNQSSKRFETEKEALRWAEKVNKRFSGYSFKPVFIKEFS